MDLKKDEFMLTDEEVHRAYFENRGRWDSDARRAIANAEAKKLVAWLKKHNNCPVIREGRAFTLTLKDWQRLLKAVEK